MFVQTSPRPEIAEVRNCAWEEFREIHREKKKKTTFPKAKQIRGCGITSLIPPPPPPSHHVLSKPRQALSGWIFWGSREGKAFSVALPSPWIKQHKTSWLSRLHHPQPLPRGILPPKKAVWAEYQKTKGFYLQWRAAPRKGESLQAAWPKSMLWTHARPGVTEPCRAREGQKPLTHQPCPARRCSFAAPSLGVDLCLLSKLIMRE